MSGNSSGEQRKAARLIDTIERVIYYGAAFFLLVTIAMVFYDAAASILEVRNVGPLKTALEVLDKILLLFIFAGTARHHNHYRPVRTRSGPTRFS